MSRDLITSPYGRFFHLPKLLGERGHDVRLLLLDYENAPSIEADLHGIRCISVPLARYARTIRRQIEADQPDWLVGFSDTYFGILAARYGRRYRIRSCIDAYDNYESYLPWLKPLHWVWRRALARTDLVSAAGPGLVELMTGGDVDRATAIVPMAADPIGFEPRDKIDSRRQLGLPEDGTLIGYCGSMHKSRGVEVLFDAITLLRKTLPGVELIHSGRTFKDVLLPSTVRSLGYIEEAKMPALLNSMDTLVVVNRPSAFGHYSHPVKLYEAMSCQVPVVASRTRATEWILKDHPDRLVVPEDPAALSAAIARSLAGPPAKYRSLPTWQSSCDVLEQALASAAKRELSEGTMGRAVK